MSAYLLYVFKHLSGLEVLAKQVKQNGSASNFAYNDDGASLIPRLCSNMSTAE